jgi:undecaprenyl-diphosphatase
MPLLVIVVLALVQGITEFLPISSSGHLVLVHEFFANTKPSENAWAEHMRLDIAVHLGTLFSVLLFFRKDIALMLFGAYQAVEPGPDDLAGQSGFKLMKLVIAASIPVLIAGFIMHLYEPSWLLKIEVVGWATIIFGLILGWADRKPERFSSLNDMNFKHALIIGLTQILALIPGTSRSGITMTSARAPGFARSDAAKFSLLLSIIAIGGAGAIGLYELYQSGDMSIGMDFMLAALLAFLTGLIAIALMMKWLEKATFMPFVIYRLILGCALLYIAYTNGGEIFLNQD